MPKFLLIHTINSSETKQKLENYLSGLVHILNFESDNNCYIYEITTNSHKNELIGKLNTFINILCLNKSERVVLYDTSICSDILEKPSKKEKIILNGDIEKENRIEEIIITLFKYIKMKEVLNEAEKRYFDSMRIKLN